MRHLVAKSACLVILLAVSSLHAQSNTGTATSGGSPEAPPAGTSSGASSAAMPPVTPDASGPSAPAAGNALVDARTAFQEGTRLAKQGRCPEAIEAFERSATLHPHAITTYNIGYCERLLGHWTRARKMLQKALADHKARGETELPPDLVAATQAFLSEADEQIARVLVTVSPDVVAVGVDGGPLELVASDGPHPVLLAGTRGVGPAEVPPPFTFEVQLDPGSHLFVLATKGRAEIVARETLAPGSDVVLELRVPPSDGGGTSRSALASPEGAPAEKPHRLPAYVALGIGAAGLVTGTVSGLLAFGKKSAVSSACGPNGDSNSCDSEREAGNRAADISTVGFIAGGVGVAAGAVLFLTASGGKGAKASLTASSRAEVRPWLGWRSLGVQGAF